VLILPSKCSEMQALDEFTISNMLYNVHALFNFKVVLPRKMVVSRHFILFPRLLAKSFEKKAQTLVPVDPANSPKQTYRILPYSWHPIVCENIISTFPLKSFQAELSKHFFCTSNHSNPLPNAIN
jgi:hypothetical protein